MGSPVSPARGPHVNRFPRYTCEMLVQAIVLALFLVGPALADGLPPGLTLGERAVVRGAIDGDTLRLADGRELRLAAVAAPRPALPRSGAARPDARLDALVAAARQASDDWAGGERVDLYFPAQHSDRHGRVVAHVVIPGKGWLQQVLLAQGLARVQTSDGTAAGATVLLPTEAAARAERRGLWDHPLFQIRSAEDSGRWLDTFQLIEGPVARVGPGRGTSRIELGAGERRLAVIVSSKARAELRSAGVELAALTGRTLRVRGWIRWQDGARLELTHAASLELVDR